MVPTGKQRGSCEIRMRKVLIKCSSKVSRSEVLMLHTVHYRYMKYSVTDKDLCILFG